MTEKAEPLLEPGKAEPGMFDKYGKIVVTGESVLGTLTAGLWLLGGVYTVGPREVRLILHNGRLTHIETEQGLHWQPSFGREDRLASTADTSYKVPEIKVVDANGLPIVVSAVLVYRIFDAQKALLDINNVVLYVQSQASAALKLVTSRYSYEQLKKEAEEVQDLVVKDLQKKLTATGVEVVSMTLNELNYAPEIASAMLKKQQAQALVEARELVVEGACSITLSAVKKLEEGGMNLEQAEKVKIVTNLLTVVCGDDNATPVINV